MMDNDLIYRSALLESMGKVVFRNVPVEHQPYVQATCDAFEAVAKNVQAIDAVEVVRCKDCLNAMKMPEVVREYFGYREDALDCGMGCGVVLPDDYCSKGCKADAEVEG